VSFASPYLLLGLLVLPLAALAYWLLERRRARRAEHWSTRAMLPNAAARPRRRAYIPAALYLIGLTFLLVGFARPQLRTTNSTENAAPIVVLTMDVSGSMAARDVAPTRLLAARRAATRFLDELPSKYRVALVTFGDQVRVAVPPTLDRKKVIAALPTQVTPLAGTSVGDAIASSVAIVIRNLQPNQPIDRFHPPGAVVVLSDGAQTAGGTSPADATATAYVYAVPIDTIAIGTQSGVVTQPFQVNKDFKTTISISVPASPVTLQAMSQATGGTFESATSAAQAARASAQLTTGYKKNDLRAIGQPQRTRHELSAAAGAAAIAFIAAGIILTGFWFGRPA
jgi:Ca-activated chloride channel family protein